MAAGAARRRRLSDRRSGAARRIIAVAPSAAELLFALGLGDRVVGVGEYVAWPPEATRLPRLGGLLDPRLETVVALRPDLAVLLPSERELGERLTALGVDVLVVPHETVDDVARAARAVATARRRAGGGRAAGALARARAGTFATARRALGHPKVLLVAERERGQLAQLLLAGPGTFLDELLAPAGRHQRGRRRAARPGRRCRSRRSWRAAPTSSSSCSRALSPAAEAAALRADWRGVPGLPAGSVKVAVVAGDWALVPGPRLPILYRELRRALLAASSP